MNHKERVTHGSVARAPNLKGMRSLLRVSLVLAVLLPITYLLDSVYNDWHEQFALAKDNAVRSARIVDEHAVKLFDIDVALTSRLVDALADQDDRAVAQDEYRFHSLAQRVGGGYPQIAAISLFDANGKLLASSSAYPAPALSIGNREDLQASRAAPTDYPISGPMRSAITGATAFNMSLARIGRQGQFEGVVTIAMRPAYYEQFYRQLINRDDPLDIGLLKSNGAELVWYSAQGRSTDAARWQAPLLHAWHSGITSGVLNSGPVWDKASRIIAFRQVGGYDAYAVSAYPISAIWQAWLRRAAGTVSMVLLSTLGVVLLLTVSLRRLDSEETAWGRLNEESRVREEFERTKLESQRLQTLGNLVATVAHDFNNLLMAISAHAQKVLRSTPSVETDIRALLRAVGTGEALTRRLLGVARKQPLREETLSLTEWANGFALVRATLGEKNTFLVNNNPDLWPVRVDVAELELAILNIAINARDAMPGGGTFTLALSNVRLGTGEVADLSGDFLCIAMTDTGVGMAPDVAEKAFEPFFSTKPAGTGTGVGLPQSRALCERSGGAVTLYSVEGEGTTVAFYLPRATVAPSELAGRNISTAQTQHYVGRHILLVEDNDVVAEAERSLLEMLGHVVDWAADAHQALDRLAHDNSYDLVLSDVQMPGGMTGIELAELLAHERPFLPVALVTGYVEEIQRLEALRIPVFTKPFDLAELEAYICSIPESRRGKEVVRAAV